MHRERVGWECQHVGMWGSMHVFPVGTRCLHKEILCRLSMQESWLF